jgi:CBS domain-containing protein/ribosome-associated translation inhibitor RaiA
LVKTLEELAFSEIDDLVRRDVETFNPKDKVSKVLGELYGSNHYEALVEDNGKHGLVTVRDLLAVQQPDQTTIGGYPKDRWSIYRPVSPEDNVLDVTEILIEHRVRALPVVDDGSASGIICQVELVDALTEVNELSGVPAKDVMTLPVFTMEVNEPVARARKQMLEAGFSHIPVMREGKLVGVVTAKDVATIYSRPIGATTTGDVVGEKVPRYVGVLGDVMDKSPVTASAESTALEVSKMISERQKGCCVILKDDKVVGIVTPRELLSPLLRFRRPEEELVAYITGLDEALGFLDRSVVESKVMRVVRRARRIHPHISEVAVNIKTSRARGNRKRYEVDVNVYSKATDERFNLRKEGWDPYNLFDEVSKALDRVLRESKHEPRGESRTQKRIRFSLRQKP